MVLESVVFAKVSYFEHTTHLTYFLCLHVSFLRTVTKHGVRAPEAGCTAWHNLLFKECQDFYRMIFIWVFPGFKELNKIFIFKTRCHSVKPDYSSTFSQTDKIVSS